MGETGLYTKKETLLRKDYIDFSYSSNFFLMEACNSVMKT